jgi:L-rhamnose mutarotase
MSRRLVRALDLIDHARLISDYRSRHAPGAVWPEVIRHIRATGVLEMEIWLVKNRLFMILEVTDDFPREVAEHARVADWERLMSKFQQPLPGAPGDPKWIELTRIFSLQDASEVS